MKILWIIGSLNPVSGGPVEVLKGFTVALKDLGHPCEVVTLDVKHGSGVDDFPGIVHALGPSWGKYCYNIHLLPWLQKNANRFDAVIVSGIWEYQSFAAWLASKKVHIPYFIFPHGMLDPWFKIAYPLKHIKKWFYWPWATYRVLRDATAVLFTSAEERKLASQSFWLYKANELVINFGVSSPQGNPDLQRQEFLNKFPDLRKKRLVLFLSRIHPKKGCDILINAFAQIANQDQDLHLVMAGPDQEGWQSILMQQASQLGINGRITWTSMLNGDLKWGAFHAADVFILPSHSENFGVVVAEALACGLPVLISDKVNIWREIINDHAGFVDLDTVDGIIRLLKKWLQVTHEDRQMMRKNAQNCFMNQYEIKMAAEKMIEKIHLITENESRNRG